MKDFYREHEPYYTGDNELYNKQKREKVLEVIKPICQVFEIGDFDYVLTKDREQLIVEGQAIGCMGNSIGSIVMELINYIWIKTYAQNRSLGAFEKQTLNRLREFWN